MRRALCATLACLLLTPGVPAPSAAPADGEPFLLGVLRRDGVVLPFAAYDGKRWEAPWPSTLRAQELPITIDDVPKRWWGKGGRPERLARWVDGRQAGAVTLQKPTVLPLMCATRLALRTDYQSPEMVPPPFEQPHPKDGLVISGAQAIPVLPAIPRTSPEWSSAAVALLGEFNKVEELATRQYFEWRHPVPRDLRRIMPIEIEALYRAPMEEEGWAAYYVEAVRRYAPGPDDAGCGLVTFVSGWVRLGPKGSPLYDIGGRVTSCDRRGAGFMLPFGLMSLDGKTYWVYQMSGYDREWYVVARPTPRSIELHVEYPAGVCPR